ncbi:MAG: xanthine dehydrogenase accessory factor [Paracoccaceae bacterium]
MNGVRVLGIIFESLCTVEVIKDPIEALSKAPDGGVLAVIIGVQGPSYRPVGAMMCIFPNGERTGSLSSGCIEADLVLHAKSALENGRPKSIVYGLGSPFIDIELPCGGGLEILLIPNPDTAILAQLTARRNQRLACSVVIKTKTGTFELAEVQPTKRDSDTFVVRLLPDINFFIFGKGPEASTFAALVQSTGYENLLLSPDNETLNAARQLNGASRHLKSPQFPTDIAPDKWSAIVLFFHDHEWEPEILLGALRTNAFYIGAQGSQRARDNRNEKLRALGATKSELQRLKGPIGLVPSARDSRTLAVSVLAEILS